MNQRSRTGFLSQLFYNATSLLILESKRETGMPSMNLLLIKNKSFKFDFDNFLTHLYKDLLNGTSQGGACLHKKLNTKWL